MAFVTGDLLPRASGRAHIGVEEGTVTGSFDPVAVPYGHIHAISGIIHDPIMGQSGVVRFNRLNRLFEFSTDGGGTFLAGIGDDIVFANNALLGSYQGLILRAATDISMIPEDDLLANAGDAIQLQSNGASEDTWMALSSDIRLDADQQLTLQAFDASGQLRYEFGPYEAWHVSPSHTADFFPIPHSGQVNQMILEGPGGTPQSLQNAYDGGDEILLATANNKHDAIIVKESVPGVDMLDLPTVFVDILDNASIAVSGHSATPLNPNSSHLTAITSQGIIIRSSGTDAIPASILSFGYPDNFVPNVAHIGTSGKLILNADKQLTFLADDGDILFDTSNNAIHNNDIRLDASAQITLQAFDFGPLASGQLEYRFGPYEAWSVFSVGLPIGGSPAADGWWPLPHSGQISEMIATQGGGGGSQSLQAAYDGGNEIDVPSSFDGVLIKEVTPGSTPPVGILQSTPLLGLEGLSYGIAVSGFTLTPEDPNSYSFCKMESNGITIKASGRSNLPAHSAFIGYGNALDGWSPNALLIRSSGNISAQADTGQNWSSQDGNIGFTAGQASPGNGLGGQITLAPFAGSGNLQYRLGGTGGHEAWHNKPTWGGTGGPNGDGFHPIPHSGQIIQMILEEASPHTLQAAYNGGPNILLRNNDMVFAADTAKTVLTAFSKERAPLNISGVLTQNATQELGDINAFAHNLPGLDPHGGTTQAELDALAIAAGSMGFDTGSGVAAFMLSSGIQKFQNGGGQVITTAFPSFTRVTTSVEKFESDGHWVYDSSVTGIRVLTAGLYLATGTTGLTSNTTTTLFSQLRVNGTNVPGAGNAGAVVATQFVGLPVVSLLNLHPRDEVSVQVSKLAAGATVSTVGSETTLNLIYLGPPRGQTS